MTTTTRRVRTADATGPAATTTLVVAGRTVAVLPSKDLETALEAAAHWLARAVRDGDAPDRLDALARAGGVAYRARFERVADRR